MDESTEHIFVYGTLRRGADHPMGAQLETGATYLGPARWRGRLYSLGPYPAAVRDAGHTWVLGDLYRLDDPALLSRLDEYEVLGPDDREGYHRIMDNVHTDDGPRRAWLYTYTGRVRRRDWIPDGDWLRHKYATPPSQGRPGPI